MANMIIYTKNGCPYCAAAKKHFQDQGTGFTEYNVTEDRLRLEEMLKLNGGQKRVPTIVEEGKVSVGYNGS